MAGPQLNHSSILLEEIEESEGNHAVTIRLRKGQNKTLSREYEAVHGLSPSSLLQGRSEERYPCLDSVRTTDQPRERCSASFSLSKQQVNALGEAEF